jgi:hypothetical protein
MEDQGVAIDRWKRPSEVLWSGEGFTEPITLLRVMPQPSFGLEPEWYDWIAQGNTLVMLGLWQGVTKAPFSSQLPSDQGPVQVDTRRRKSLEYLIGLADSLEETQPRLEDDYGAVVWQTQFKSAPPFESGILIQASTAYLGANAYQDNPGNFDLLTQLVTEAGHPVWVDEYLHGFRELQGGDADLLPTQQTWAGYLAQTPLLLVMVQVIALTLALLWGQQRLGLAITPSQPVPSNSEAYITALASVLRQANSTGFVVEMITRAERLRLQKYLGLGSVLVDEKVLVEAWQKQHPDSSIDLSRLLQIAQGRSLDGRSAIREQDLLTWLQKMQAIWNETKLASGRDE